MVLVKTGFDSDFMKQDKTQVMTWKKPSGCCMDRPQRPRVEVRPVRLLPSCGCAVWMSRWWLPPEWSGRGCKMLSDLFINWTQYARTSQVGSKGSGLSNRQGGGVIWRGWH